MCLKNNGVVIFEPYVMLKLAVKLHSERFSPGETDLQRGCTANDLRTAYKRDVLVDAGWSISCPSCATLHNIFMLDRRKSHRMNK